MPLSAMCVIHSRLTLFHFNPFRKRILSSDEARDAANRCILDCSEMLIRNGRRVDTDEDRVLTRLETFLSG